MISRQFKIRIPEVQDERSRLYAKYAILLVTQFLIIKNLTGFYIGSKNRDSLGYFKYFVTGKILIISNIINLQKEKEKQIYSGTKNKYLEIHF